jgi:hypothetical protein
MLGFLRYGVIKRIFDWDIFFYVNNFYFHVYIMM